jgi:hypothetical protein
MDSFLDFLDLIPVVPTSEAALVLAGVLMLSTLWLLRRKRKLAAAMMAILGLALGIGAGSRLATWKELPPSQKILAASMHYNHVAAKQIASLIRQQYPRHQVVALFPPDIAFDNPYRGLSSLKAGLDPNTKMIAIHIKPDEASVKEALAECCRQGNCQAKESDIRQNLMLLFDNWFCGRNVNSAVETAGLTGDVVVVSFAGMPSRGTADIKAAGRPVLVVAGKIPNAGQLVGDGTIAAALLPRPETLNNPRCLHNQEKAFNHRWFLLTKATLADAQRLPGLFDEDDPPVAIAVPAPGAAIPLQKKN